MNPCWLRHAWGKWVKVLEIHRSSWMFDNPNEHLVGELQRRECKCCGKAQTRRIYY